MHINTLWIAPLAYRTGLPQVAIRDGLLNDSCFNVAAAGLIMGQYLNETKGDLLFAVGNYHSHVPLLNQDKQIKIMDAARTMFVAVR
jgi:hypothetical protein